MRWWSSIEQRRTAAGIILIAVGLAFLAGTRLGVGGEAVPAGIGIGFLIAYAFTRHYGFLVPGGILTGLGLGILYENRVRDSEGAVVLGLGLGFLSIYAIGAAFRDRPGGWWPLIPGTILVIVGLLNAANQGGVLGFLARWWPLVLIAIGVFLLLRPRTPP